MKKINEYIKHPSKILLGLDRKRLINLNDRLYLKLVYKEMTNKKLNLKNPQTFNEKLQWLKLYDRKDIYTKMVDKYDVKGYVSNIIGGEYIINTLGIYNDFDEIEFDKLPNQFVIKCTHDSGGIIIVKDKTNFNIEHAKNKINKCLNKNYYHTWREWPYKNVKPRIIIEKYMEDDKYKTIRDYKFFCFNGISKFLYISEGLENHETAKIQFFDMNFNKVEFKRKDYKQFDVFPEKPVNFELMKELAQKLSKNIPHVRIDFYEINGNVYFGEMTFFTSSGFIPFEPEEWDYKLGDLIDLKGVK